MRIRMLGTGYGECKIKKKTVMDFRRRGGVLIDDRILIDAPSDIFDVADELGFSDMFSKVSDVIISHSHEGHFSADTIEKLAASPIRIYATGKVLELIPENPNIEKIKLSTSTPVEFDGYTLYSLPANHATEIKGEMCLNFIISKDKALLYALDGGGINFNAWKTVSQLKLNAVITECALELSPTVYASTYHNNLASASMLRDILVSGGITEENAKFVLTHIPMSKKRSIHTELSDEARALGMFVAYDGYYFSV